MIECTDIFSFDRLEAMLIGSVVISTLDIVVGFGLVAWRR